MKVLITFILLLFYSLAPNSYILVSANTGKFARALNGNVNLYRLSVDDNNIENVLCLIEKTYFVEIVSDNVDCYKVNYNGISGYIKKNDVALVQNEPTTPFPVNIKMTIASNCNLRSSPTTHPSTNNILSTIYSGETNLTFIGRIFAEEAIDFGGTTWYYVSHNGQRGYIYNKYIKSITPIYPNTEETIAVSTNNFTQVSPLNDSNSIIVIILLFIPCIGILILLYLPRKTSTRQKAKKSRYIDRY